MKIEKTNGLSQHSHPYILESITAALNDTPQNIRDVLLQTKIIVGQRMIDIHPHYSKKKPRKTIPYSIESYNGIYKPDVKTIYLAQEERRGKEYIYQPAWNNRYSLFLHELGHAFDHFLHSQKLGSISDEFAICYQKDISNLLSIKVSIRKKIIINQRYYLFKGIFEKNCNPCIDSSRREVFAEAFSHIIGGLDNDYSNDHNHEHKSAFVNCYQLVENYIRCFAPDIKMYPNYNRVFIRTSEQTPINTDKAKTSDSITTLSI